MTRDLGRRGEALAGKFLEDRGYRVLEYNYSSPQGEIDIIARQGPVLVFVEVKTRVNKTYGLAREAVHPGKQRHIVLAASSYLKETGSYNSYCRFDVVEVYMDLGTRMAKLEHIKDAFDLNDLEG